MGDEVDALLHQSLLGADEVGERLGVLWPEGEAVVVRCGCQLSLSRTGQGTHLFWLGTPTWWRCCLRCGVCAARENGEEAARRFGA